MADARNLKAMDIGGTSDPYCIIQLGGQQVQNFHRIFQKNKRKKENKNKVIKNSRNNKNYYINIRN